MRVTRLAAALAAAVFAPGLSISASAHDGQAFTVNCSRGQTIAQALELGDARKPLVLIIRGMCKENVVVARDRVTLRGDPPRVATVQAVNPKAHAIEVRATWVSINGLTVTGGLNGIMATGVSALSVTNSVIQNAVQSGVILGAGFGWLEGNTIQNNGSNGLTLSAAQAYVANSEITTNVGSGIRLNNNSTLVVSGTSISANGGSGLYLDGKSAIQATDNTISSNGASGISIYSGSYGRLQDNNTINANGTNAALSRNGVDLNQSSAEIWGGSISNHAAPGVAAALSSVQIAGTAITGNGGGVLGYLASTVTISDATITSNAGAGVGLDTNSTAQIASSTINNNGDHGIRLLFGSRLKMVTPATLVGANSGYGLWCGDAESSVFGTNLLNFSPPNAAGGVAPSCTGF